MPNPIFYERQRRRASTWDTPRFLRSYDETLDGDLILPRGPARPARRRWSSRPAAAWRSPTSATPASRTTFDFTAELDPEQQAAHDAAARPRPRRAGRPARRRQDRHRLRRHRSPRRLDPRAGRPQGPRRPVARPASTSYSASRPGSAAADASKTTGVIDVATLQTLARRDDVAELTAGYGLVVVDECHHVPAAAFEHAVAPDPRPPLARPDRHPLPPRPARRPHRPATRPDPAHHHASPHRTPSRSRTRRRRHGTRAGAARAPHRRSATPATSTRPRRAASPPSTATSPPTTPATDQIVADVTAALQRGRHCLVLTQWTAHLDALAARAHASAGTTRSSCAAAWAPRLAPPPSPGSNPGRRAAAAGRRHRPLHRRRLRLPRPGHPVPRRTDRLQRPPRPVRRPYPAPAPRQDDRRGPRLPRHRHRRARLVAGQTRPRLHQPRLPRPPSCTHSITTPDADHQAR